MAKSRSIKVTLEFKEDDLNEILDAANFTDEPSLTVADLSPAMFRKLKNELQTTSGNFVEEIVEGTREACANDWLIEFSPGYDEDED